MSGGSSSGGSSNDGDGMVDYKLSRGGTAYHPKDAARETGAGGKETARAWHQARDDAQEVQEKEGEDWKISSNRHKK